MIVNRLELNDAVAEGIVSRDQAVRLHELSVRSSGGDDSLIDLSHDTRDEPFRLLRGFRDVFIAIGVGIFVVGLSAMVLPITGKFWSDLNVLSVGESVFSIFIPLGLCIFGLVQAEIITRIYRLPLSSLVVVLAFAVWSANLFGLIASLSIASFSQFSGQIFHPAESIVIWAAAAGAMSGTAVFYWRYRLPFALFLLAGSLVGLSLLIIRGVMGAQWFEDYARILIGLWGSIVFLAAMWFDTRDRLRVTRFSECAFWLHLFAAPMLVHAFLFGDPLGAPKLGLVLITMAVFSAIALIIDRRALLVSGLSYFAVAISQLVSSSALFGDQEFALTAIILGAIVLTLGLGWTPMRRRALAILPFESLKTRLPPTAP